MSAFLAVMIWASVIGALLSVVGIVWVRRASDPFAAIFAVGTGLSMWAVIVVGWLVYLVLLAALAAAGALA